MFNAQPTGTVISRRREREREREREGGREGGERQREREGGGGGVVGLDKCKKLKILIGI